MNYFQLHLGDWAQGVAHLSLLEEGVYLRLLRRYYAEEKPLPSDLAACQRLAGARSQDEREAVVVVLAEFFALTDDGYRNKRADQEIAKFHEGEPEREAKKANERERQQRTREERRRLFDELRERGVVPAYDTTTTELRRLLSQPVTRDVTRTPDVTTRDDTATHTPVTINQEPVKKEQSARAARLPQDWQPSPDELAWARNARPDVDLATEAAKFRDYWHAQGGQRGAKADWSATWRNWIRNSHAPPRRGTPTAAPSKQMQGLANILGLTHESNDPSRLVLDLDSSGFGADVRQLPPRLPGC